jgi:hypothetical protein
MHLGSDMGINLIFLHFYNLKLPGQFQCVVKHDSDQLICKELGERRIVNI